MSKKISDCNSIELEEILGESSIYYMRIAGKAKMWREDIPMSEKESYLQMLDSGDKEMTALAYTIITEKYDKREEKGKVLNC